MKKLIFAISVLMIFASGAQAAFLGFECDGEQGDVCWGSETYQEFISWTKWGTIEEMGSNCEKFMGNLEARENRIAQNQDVLLSYRNENRVLAQRENEKMYCRTQIYSELPLVRIHLYEVATIPWVCDEKIGLLCAHTVSECIAARDEALKDPAVLDASVYMDVSPISGRMCKVMGIKLKNMKRAQRSR